MFDLTALLPHLEPAMDWRLAFPALGLPAAAMLPLAARRGGAQWLQWRLQALPRENYQVVQRPRLPVSPGGDRLEYVVLSPHGVFLVQVVNRSGHIIGNPTDKLWAQKIGGKSRAFHNPLRLGRRWAAMVAASIDIDPALLFPVVAFTGRCKFDTPMPANLTGPLGCLDYVRTDTGVELDDDELARIRAGIEAGLHDPRRHAQPDRVRVARHDEAAALAHGHAAGTVCPRCGAALGAYSYKTGTRAGQMFSGCTNFPACSYRAYPIRKKADQVAVPA